MAGKIKQIWEAIAACFRANDRPLTMAQTLAWIGTNYSDADFNPATIKAQVYGSCVNVESAHIYRKDTPKILFFERSNRTYRSLDPAELSKDYAQGTNNDPAKEPFGDVDEDPNSGSTFALEAHLRDYLALHLSTLEKGLRLWSDSPPSVEYVLGGRRIDLLAKDLAGIPVVIELKLNRGYDRVAGQALLYQGLVADALGVQRVRIILVAAEITEELKIATARLPDVDLFEYVLTMEVTKVSSSVGKGD